MSQIQDFMQMVIPVQHCNDGINYARCKECAEKGPVCCQRLPCSISPEEVKDLSLQGICDLIDTGLVTIDWWMGRIEDDGTLDLDVTQTAEDIINGNPDNRDPTHQSFFLRMRGKGDPVVHPAIMPCICSAWDKDKGCMFPYSYRPKGGRCLLPPQCALNPTDDCKETYTKKRTAFEWSPYHDILQQAYEKYKEWWADSPTLAFGAELSKMFFGTPEQMEIIKEFMK